MEVGLYIHGKFLVVRVTYICHYGFLAQNLSRFYSFFLIELNNFPYGTLSCVNDSFKDAPEEYNFLKKSLFQFCQFFNPNWPILGQKHENHIMGDISSDTVNKKV